MKVIRVALDVPLPRLFDYRLDDDCIVRKGQRVSVPFGSSRSTGRTTVAVVFEVDVDSQVDIDRLKPVLKILDDTPPLSAEWLELVKFCAAYYQRPIGEAVFAALPPGLRSGRPAPRQPGVLRPVRPLDSLLEMLPATATRKRQVLQAFAQGALGESSIAALAPADRACVRQMTRDGLLVREDAPGGLPHFVAAHALNTEQADVTRSICAGLGKYAVHVLFGITGSGKTEIYLNVIAAALARGLQALVLVPEIALTPALQQAFGRRFPEAHIVMQHSAMAEGERSLAWLDAQSGRAQIVLGTRLAALVPLGKPGLIVVDEEQDGSFKQQDGLRYSARDLAVYRASVAGIPIILASATPSMETYQHALRGRYRLHRLTARAHAQARLPAVHLIDSRLHPATHGISEPIVAALRLRLERKEQSLVFLNRRGYAPVLCCPACGWVSDCPDCAAHLVLHLKEARLRCHHCGHEDPVPRACPQCRNVDLRPVGRGTQRLEETLSQQFPEARLLRIDRDSTRRRGSLQAMLEQVHGGTADILVGTQILAKGHDFARLTLVVILNADAGLFAADYRASERLFTQLEQVAGRAGRAGLPGEVLIQTRFPRHPLYQALQSHDFEGFARTLLAEREQAGFPPFIHEAALRVEAPRMELGEAFLHQAIELAPGNRSGITLFKPVPLSIARVARLERAQVVVQAGSRAKLQSFLSGWQVALQQIRARNLRWHIDVDPTEF